jgi:regulator of sirC expression with transglutaminase-like and TPR domain
MQQHPAPNSPQSELAALARLAEQPDARIDLCAAALTISRLFGGYAEPAAAADDAQARLDLITAAARARVPADAELLEQVRALNLLLFDELGFAGNQEDFYDPRNSFLDQVLQRRLGIPITLAMVYCEVAARLDIPAYGVGFPGHFLVRVGRGATALMLDVYAGGVALPEAELDRRLVEIFGDGAPTIRSQPSLLRPATNREILVRMLRNLIGIYRARGDNGNLLEALTAVLAVAPDLPDELRQRGLLYRDLGYVPAALADLRRFAEFSDDASQIAAVSPVIEALESQPQRLH